MRRLILSSLLFVCSVSGAKNVTKEGVPGVGGIISVKSQKRDEALWHTIGQKVNLHSLQDLSVRSLFEVLRVNVSSANAANIKVVFNGGTDISWLDPPDLSHPLYQSLYRKYCASWFGGGSSVNCENVVLPRFGIWAPFGATQIAVTQDSTSNFDYTITYRKEYDQSRAIRMGIGMFFFMFGGFFSHSQPVHYLVASALGSVGFVVVLLFIGMRFVPGNKPAFAIVGAASATFMAWLYNTLRDALTTHITQYLPYYLGLMGLGGFAGFAYAYKHPLDASSRFLCLLFIRVASLGLIIFEGPTSVLVSLVTVALMSLVLLLRRCGCSPGSLCNKKPDEPLYEKSESDGDSSDEEPIPEPIKFSRREPVSFSQREPASFSQREPASYNSSNSSQREPANYPYKHDQPLQPTPSRAQNRNTSNNINRNSAPSSSSTTTPLRATPIPSYSSSDLPMASTIYNNDSPGFDFKDVPLPPVTTLTPQFILPLGQTFEPDSSEPMTDPEEVLQQLEGEFETFIKEARKRIIVSKKRSRTAEEPSQKVRKVEK